MSKTETELTVPIAGIENRTSEEVFAIMCAWIRNTKTAEREKRERLEQAMTIRHQWQPQNRGYQYARFVCTVCGMKSDIDCDEELCGVGATAYIESQEVKDERD